MTTKEKLERLVEKGTFRESMMGCGDMKQVALMLKALPKIAPCILSHPRYSDVNVIAFVDYMWEKCGDK